MIKPDSNFESIVNTQGQQGMQKLSQKSQKSVTALYVSLKGFNLGPGGFCRLSFSND